MIALSRIADITPPAPASAAGTLSLCALARGVDAVVVSVEPPSPELARDHPLARRLIELGFVAGEPLRVIAHGCPGADPIGVRIGGCGGAATFALRRSEAAWVRVRALAKH